MQHRHTVLAVILLALGIMQAATAQNKDTAQVIVSKVQMPQLNRDRTIRVYLPAGYTSAKQRYPVIYMHDGQNIFTGNTSFAGSWNVDSLLKTLPANKQCIVVGIDNSGKYRMSEYNAYDSQYGKAEGALYIEFIVKTLKPHIDSIYRTKQEAKFTTIAGSSMGGLIAMYGALNHPEVFGNAGIFSPAFWIAPKMYTDVAEAKMDTRQRFFLSCGDQEGRETEYVIKMDSLLTGHGYNRNNVPVPLVLAGAKHNEAQWRSSFERFYKWLMK